jgi:hypothetical protein
LPTELLLLLPYPVRRLLLLLATAWPGISPPLLPTLAFLPLLPVPLLLLPLLLPAPVLLLLLLWALWCPLLLRLRFLLPVLLLCQLPLL